MSATVNILLPIDPLALAIFLGLLVVVLLYYGVKFVITLALGG